MGLELSDGVSIIFSNNITNLWNQYREHSSIHRHYTLQNLPYFLLREMIEFLFFLLLLVMAFLSGGNIFWRYRVFDMEIGNISSARFLWFKYYQN